MLTVFSDFGGVVCLGSSFRVQGGFWVFLGLFEEFFGFPPRSRLSSLSIATVVAV